METVKLEKMKQAACSHFFIEDYGAETLACIERARYWTESFKETGNQPRVIKNAKALANYLEKRTIYIQPYELIVGGSGRTPAHIPFYVELQPLERLRTTTVAPNMLTPEEWKELEEIYCYWNGQTYTDLCLQYYPEEVKKAVYPREFRKVVESGSYESSAACPCPDLRMLLSIGLNGIMKNLIEPRLAELDPHRVPSTKVDETIKKRDTLTAMLIAGKAAIKLAERYSQLARELAEETNDFGRKSELEQIAKNCARVPAEPAETFWQALQGVWFVHLIGHVHEMLSLGFAQRLDQDLIPYYRRDIESGKLTREDAQTLLAHLWTKFERDRVRLVAKGEREGRMGGVLFQNISLGGLDAYGRDATNELTYLMLDVTKKIRTVQPTLSIKYHPGTPDDLILKAFEVIKTGIGMPAFYSEKPINAHMLSTGASLPDARNNTISACCCITVPGTAHGNAGRAQSNMSLHSAKCLELALNDGVDMMDGEELGPKTGDPRNFSSFEDLLQAFRTQLDYACRIGAYANNIHLLKTGEFTCRPFSSLLVRGAIERGQDITTYNDSIDPLYNVDGAVDAADSLTAIKKLIYDDRKVNWDEMLKALKANWEGYEHVWQLCHDAPKFGEDDDYADSIAVTTINIINDAMAKWPDIHGKPCRGAYQSVSYFVTKGKLTAALPCGRKAGRPLADGGISPSTGFGKIPTAVIKSVAKIDADYGARLLLNQRLSLSTTPKQFLNFIRAWGELGLSHTQFNVFDVKTLKDAQVYPEKYPDLIVRVAGYSAHFAYLNKEAQDSIILRAEQSFA
jgi:pyruvate formate-lyase/glycerol dehydratase family glycyl radical enzyme